MEDRWNSIPYTTIQEILDDKDDVRDSAEFDTMGNLLNAVFPAIDMTEYEPTDYYVNALSWSHDLFRFHRDSPEGWLDQGYELVTDEDRLPMEVDSLGDEVNDAEIAKKAAIAAAAMEAEEDEDDEDDEEDDEVEYEDPKAGIIEEDRYNNCLVEEREWPPP